MSRPDQERDALEELLEDLAPPSATEGTVAQTDHAQKRQQGLRRWSDNPLAEHQPAPRLDMMLRAIGISTEAEIDDFLHRYLPALLRRMNRSQLDRAQLLLTVAMQQRLPVLDRGLARGLMNPAIRPVSVPEITPAMTEAGASELLRYVPEYEDPEQVAKRIFSAMMARRD